MGIDPIRYKPWSGTRTPMNERMLVISRTLFSRALKSKWVVLLLVLGYLGVWAVPIVMYSLMPHEELDAELMAEQMGGSALSIFSVLLASLVCSDAISEDLRTSSFVLYFSRPLGKVHYLAGKFLGAFMVLAMFCLVPAAAMAAIIMGTQSGGDYVGGVGVLGVTLAAGLVATLFTIPFGLMMSSLTKRKSFAAIGTFVVFFVLTIVGGIFSEFDANWELVSPSNALSRFIGWMYGTHLPHGISGGLLAAVVVAFMVVPAALVYMRVHLKAVGK